MWTALFIIIVSPFSKVKSFYISLLKAIMLILWLAFQRKSLLSFYLFFELSILPVLFLILGWGYQPERISSSFYIFFYTLFGSLPLLFIIVLILAKTGNMRYFIDCDNANLFRKSARIIIIGAFLVKLPLYFTHMWLPKAHVEAPVAGSIILAGLILKLGGYGLLLCSLFPIIFNSALILLVRLSSFGGFAVRMLITRLTDIKVIIAYSSVVHISLVAVGAIAGGAVGVSGLLLIIICHGFASPGIFAGANMYYERSHSRRVILNKGLLGAIPALTLFWFSLIVLNFGGPFTANLLSEILLINILRGVSLILLVWAAGMCFFSLVYNLILYASLNQGENNNRTPPQKLIVREILILLNITYPAVIFLLRVQV